MGDHDENWPIRSQTFKRFISKQFYEEQQKALGNDALSAAINLIEANALFSGQQHEAHVRVAEHEGNIYIDLGNDAWEVVEITSKGWRVRQASQRLWSIGRLTGFASSDPFASRSAPVSEPVEGENEVRSDANRCELPFHDADDANDANPGTSTEASVDNDRGW